MWQKFFYEDFPWVRSILAWTTLCIYRIWKVRIKLVFCLLNNNSFFFSFSFFDWDAVDVSLLNLFESMYYLLTISVIVWHAAQQIKKTPTYFVVAEWRIIKIRLLCPSALNNHLKWKLLADTDTDISLQTDSPLLLAVNAGRGEAFPHNWKEVPSDIICIHMIKLVPLWCFISVDTDKTGTFPPTYRI